MESPTFERVAQLIATECGVPRADIRPDADVERDLGVTGDDGADLMAAYAREFGVDMADLELARHFGPEGCLPGFGLYWRLRHGYWPDREPLTVQMLVDAAAAGRWPPYGERRQAAT
jgi:acyl carrier protein